MKSYTNQTISLAAFITSVLAVGGSFALAPAAHAAYGVAPSPVINEACGGNRNSPTCLENAWNYDAEAQMQASYQYRPTYIPYPAYNYNSSYYVAPTTYNYTPSYVAPEPEYSYPTTSYYYTPSYNASSYEYEYANNYSYNYSDGSNSYDYCNGSYDCSY